MANFNIYKKELAEFLLASGFSINQLVAYFGYSRPTLYRWKKEFECDPNSLINFTTEDQLRKFRTKLHKIVKTDIEIATQSSRINRGELVLMYQRLLFLSMEQDITTEIKVLGSFAKHIQGCAQCYEQEFLLKGIAEYISNKMLHIPFSNSLNFSFIEKNKSENYQLDNLDTL